jgi:hypothetical protein
MNIKGLFANNVKTPNWLNKAGENEFDKLLNRLAEIGKKISGKTVEKKTADMTGKKIKADEVVTPEVIPSKEQTVMPAFTHYDAQPRPLGDLFYMRGKLTEEAMLKAREIVGAQVAKMNCPATDVYLLRTDIARFDGNGTPTTGRISFQIPFMTAQGDSRTVYADVDIVLGSLMPPRYFQDGMNQKFAFSEEGVNSFLAGRDFEMLQNPKVTPETVFFETPGHLASRSEIGMTKHAAEEKIEIGIEEMNEIVRQTGEAVAFLEKTEEDLVELGKDVKNAQIELGKYIKTTPQYEKKVKLETEMKKTVDKQKDLLAQLEQFLLKIKSSIVTSKGKIYTFKDEERKSQTPVWKKMLGMILKKAPELKSTIDTLHEEMRTLTHVKLLERETPGEATKQWEIRRESPVQPVGEEYMPPNASGIEEDTTASVKKNMTKEAGVISGIEELARFAGELELIVEEVEKV